MTTGGVLLANRYEKHYEFIKFIELYDQYPEDIKKMIDNNNSSYAHRWQRPDYLDIVA
jgi:hypothetical protein